MRRLRGPDGCPWDREQTFATIAPYTVEEAYEVAAAIEDKDYKSLPDELGDLLFQVVFHARMAEEQGLFDFGDVVAGRHRQDDPPPSACLWRRRGPADRASQKLAWEELKASERASKARSPDQAIILDDVPLALPALLRAEKLQRRASSVGFDWDDAAQGGGQDRRGSPRSGRGRPAIQDKRDEEIGDLLFVVANLARHLKVDPEAALRRANAKFTRRFHYHRGSAGSPRPRRRRRQPG